jgi:hypothetical protein
MGQRSGPREVLPDGSRTALAQASLSGGGGRRYARATSSCLIFRPDRPGRPRLSLRTARR